MHTRTHAHRGVQEERLGGHILVNHAGAAVDSKPASVIHTVLNVKWI